MVFYAQVWPLSQFPMKKINNKGKSFVSQGACDFNVAVRQGLKQPKQLPNALLLILKTNYVNDENAFVQES